MRISQLQFFHLLGVLICCGAVLADQLTDLGSDVIINCDLDENDVYWILQKTADPPVVILRSFPTPLPTFYSNKTFREKYSVQFKHRLVINNITADELGVYYCMSTGKYPKFSNSSRMSITEPSEPSLHQPVQNQTTVTPPELNDTKWWIAAIMLGLLNGLLIIAMIGLVKFFTVRNRKSPKRSRQPHSTDVQQRHQSQDPDQLQYAEVDFTKLRKHIRSSQVNSTYAALNLQRT